MRNLKMSQKKNSKQNKPRQKEKARQEAIISLTTYTKMQRDISDRNTLGDTLNPINDARRSTAIDRTTSNYNDAKEKVQKIRDLVNMGKYDADLAKYIPGLSDLAIQGMLEYIDTRKKPAHPSYKDKELLDFQILVTENYYVNPNNIHICFPIKIKKKVKQQQ